MKNNKGNPMSPEKYIKIHCLERWIEKLEKDGPETHPGLGATGEWKIVGQVQ